MRASGACCAPSQLDVDSSLRTADKALRAEGPVGSRRHAAVRARKMLRVGVVTGVSFCGGSE